MKRIIAVACVAFAGMLAGQANAYTLTQTDGSNGLLSILTDGFALSGTDFSDDPGSGLSFQTYYTQSFAVDTLISFNWSYASNDLLTSWGVPDQDPAGYTLWAAPDTAFTGTNQLSAHTDATSSGSVNNLLVSAGQSFGWYVSSVDGLNGGASLTVSQLIETPVVAVPEPAAWGLMLAGLGALGIYKRSRQQAK